MKNKSTRYYVSVNVERGGHGGDMPALLDMLRYEGARVVDWDHASGGVFTVTILSEHYEPDRWASFGLHPRVTV